MKEALKLALEIALEKEYQLRKTGQSHMIEPVITAIKEALAQPEQEPVAWEQFYPDLGKPQLGQELVAIYRAGQAKGEGFHVEFLKEMGDDEVLLYTTPPKRPWVGLTDAPTYTEQQIANACWAAEISDSKCESLLIALQEAIEAALKEKNI